MTFEIEVTPAAQADLIAIWDYTESERGTEAANAYIRDLDQAMVRLAVYPRMGADCSLIRRGYRRMAAKAHLIFYRIRSSRVEVVRVLHVRQDARRHLQWDA